MKKMSISDDQIRNKYEHLLSEYEMKRSDWEKTENKLHG